MKALFLSLCFLFIASPVKAKSLPDTISYWTIYLDGVQLKNFNDNEKDPTLSLDLKKCSKKNVLTVNYSCDTPCHDCQTHLVIYDDKKRKIVDASGKGTNTPISFSLAKLIDKWNTKTSVYFQIYYFEKDSSNKKLLAILKFE